MPTGAPLHGRVLVVDDDERVRTVFVRYLTLAGFDVVAAASGVEGLRILLDEANICLVLLDLTMPEIDGLEFRERQLADERISRVPVVIVTGSGVSPTDRERLRAADYLTKPVGRDELIQFVASYCGQREP